jgi:hypothetical protein
MANFKQQTLKNAFNRQERAKKATLKKEKKRFSELYKGVSRKRSRILNRLSGLNKVKNNSKKNTARLSRIRKAKNSMLRSHRLKTPKKNERNELANLMKRQLAIFGGSRKRCN